MPVRLAIDHVVIRVHELDAAVGDYAALGFTVVRGGEHPGLGSHNALIAFDDDSYLELIAFRRPPWPGSAPAAKAARARELAAEGRSALECRMLSWEATPEGLVDFALVPADAEAVIREARADSLELAGPVPGGRLRPDGQRVAWVLALPDGFDLPFLCGDVTPRALRVPAGDARRHANGVTGIAQLEVEVSQLEPAAARYRALLQGDAATCPPNTRGACEFRLGNATMILVERSQGNEGPSALTLLADSPRAGAPLDPALTHGARIVLLPTAS